MFLLFVPHCFKNQIANSNIPHNTQLNHKLIKNKCINTFLYTYPLQTHVFRIV